MSSTHKIWLSIVVMLLLVPGLGQAYFWYRTHYWIALATTALQPFAELDYGDSSTGLSGSVTITDLRLTAPGGDALRIESLTIDSPNLFALLNIDRDLSQGRLPKAGAVAIRNLELSFDGRWWRRLRLYGTRRPVKDSGDCGLFFLLPPTHLKALGYDRLRLDLEFGYNLNEFTRTVKVASKFDLREMLAATLALDLTFAALPVALPPAVPPRLSGLRLTLEDTLLNERLNRFCGDWSKSGADQYLLQQGELLRESLSAWGIVAGLTLAEAYRGYRVPGGTLAVNLQPAPADPRQNRPAMVADRLNITVEINRTPATDLSLELHEPTPLPTVEIETEPAPEPAERLAVAPPDAVLEITNAPLAADRALPVTEAMPPVPVPVVVEEPPAVGEPPAVETPPAVGEPPAVETPPAVGEPPAVEEFPAPVAGVPVAPVAPEPPDALGDSLPPSEPVPAVAAVPNRIETLRYQTVPIADLSAHVGSQAVILTLDGGEHRGTIEDVVANSVKLGLRMPGGTAALFINTARIERVLILRRGGFLRR